MYIIYIYIHILCMYIYRVIKKVKKRFYLKRFNVSLLQFKIFCSIYIYIYICSFYIYIYIYIFILLINNVSDTEIKEKF